MLGLTPYDKVITNKKRVDLRRKRCRGGLDERMKVFDCLIVIKKREEKRRGKQTSWHH